MSGKLEMVGSLLLPTASVQYASHDEHRATLDVGVLS